MGADSAFIERHNVEREMIDVTALFAGRSAACPAELAIKGNKVDQRVPCAKLNEPDVVLPFFQRTAEPIDVKRQAAREVPDAQHQMIDRKNAERRHLFHRYEKLFGRDKPGRQTLLAHPTAKRLQRGPVWYQTVRPKLPSEYMPAFLDMVDQPGQRRR